ncbi:MAG: metalloregulator ArsR/SmtB family transcription factor [Candidatus Eiseniibacteriota bacterium]
MHPRAMNGSRRAAQALMACLGEESRFRLVQALIGRARCVTDLAAAVGLSQSCTTRHLQALERRGLVTGRRDGKRVLYRIREEDSRLLPLLGWALSDPKAGLGGGPRRSARRGSERGSRSAPSPGTPTETRVPAAADPSPPGTQLPTVPTAIPSAANPWSLQGGLESGPRSGPETAPDPVPPSSPHRPLRRTDIEDFLL